MYTEIGSFDAKAKLSQLLQGVQRGRRYTITLRGCPVADLVPSLSAISQDKDKAIKNMQGIQKIHGVSKKTIEACIKEGRR